MKRKKAKKEIKSSKPERLTSEKSSNEVITSQDFYLENGLMVFTEIFHLKRGYCCGSGCRHCPYKSSK